MSILADIEKRTVSFDRTVRLTPDERDKIVAALRAGAEGLEAWREAWESHKAGYGCMGDEATEHAEDKHDVAADAYAALDGEE
jgi:hypothetical protein